jgi:hypothetical protein
VMQALVAAGFSTLFHATGNYLILFGIAGVSLVVCSGFVMAAQLVRGVES